MSTASCNGTLYLHIANHKSLGLSKSLAVNIANHMLGKQEVETTKGIGKMPTMLPIKCTRKQVSNNAARQDKQRKRKVLGM